MDHCLLLLSLNIDCLGSMVLVLNVHVLGCIGFFLKTLKGIKNHLLGFLYLDLVSLEAFAGGLRSGVRGLRTIGLM